MPFEEAIANRRPARLMRFASADVGPVPLTKRGGEPYWPAGMPKPVCGVGHAMDFVVQVRLDDMPGDGADASLLVHHYCLTCMDEGNMASGHGHDARAGGYRMDLFPVPSERPAGSGVSFEAVEEVCAMEDYDDDDYLIDPEEFEEAGHPDYSNRHESKLGGWPSWVQIDGWLTCPHGQDYRFVGQLTEEEGHDWPIDVCYLWACGPTCPDRRAEMSSQNT